MLKGIFNNKGRISIDFAVACSSIFLGIWLFSPKAEAACDGVPVCGNGNCYLYTTFEASSDCGTAGGGPSCCNTESCCRVHVYRCKTNPPCNCTLPSCYVGGSYVYNKSCTQVCNTCGTCAIYSDCETANCLKVTGGLA